MKRLCQIVMLVALLSIGSMAQLEAILSPQPSVTISAPVLPVYNNSIGPATGSTATSGTFTVSGTDPAIIVAISLDSTTATVSTGANAPAWSGGGGTAADISSVRHGNAYVDIWCIPAPTATSGTLTVKMSASVAYQIAYLVVNNADQTTPCPSGNAVTNSTTSQTKISLTPTSTTSADLSVGMGAQTTSGDTLGAGPTQLFLDDTSNINAEASYAMGAGGVVNGYWQGAGTAQSMVAIRVKSDATQIAAPGVQTIDAFSDWAGASNTQAVTNARLTAGTHGGNGTWSSTITAMTFSTSVTQNLLTNKTVSGGSTYSGNTGLDVKHDMSTTNIASYGFTAANDTTTLSGFLQTSIPQTDTTIYALVRVLGTNATDYVQLDSEGGVSGATAPVGDNLIQIMIESLGAGITSSTNYYYTPPNTTNWFNLKFVKGGHNILAIYDTTGNLQAWIVSQATTGAVRAGDFDIGHTGSGTGAHFAYYMNLCLDYTNGQTLIP